MAIDGDDVATIEALARDPRRVRAYAGTVLALGTETGTVDVEVGDGTTVPAVPFIGNTAPTVDSSVLILTFDREIWALGSGGGGGGGPHSHNEYLLPTEVKDGLGIDVVDNGDGTITINGHPPVAVYRGGIQPAPVREGDHWIQDYAGVDITPAGLLTDASQWIFMGFGYGQPPGTITAVTEGIRIDWNPAAVGGALVSTPIAFLDGHLYRVEATAKIGAGPPIRLTWAFNKDTGWKSGVGQSFAFVMDVLWQAGASAHVGIGVGNLDPGYAIITAFKVYDVTDAPPSEWIWDDESGWHLIRGIGITEEQADGRYVQLNPAGNQSIDNGLVIGTSLFVGDYSAYGASTGIASGTDLDNLASVWGVSTVEGSFYATSPLNAPSGAAANGYVSQWAEPTGAGDLQRWVNATGDLRTWMRRKVAGVWQGWTEIVAGGGGGGTPAPDKLRNYATAGSFTWTRPANLSGIEVTVVGGGGAGGSAATAAASQGSVGGGGGAGGVLTAFITADELTALGIDEGETVAIVVGAAGTAVAAGTGNNGGDSSFGGTWLVAGGGQGGNSIASGVNVGIVLGGLGGVPVASGIPDIYSTPGQSGSHGIRLSATASVSGGGGSSFGAGGRQALSGINGSGPSATGRGGGGAGSVSSNGGAGSNGGQGQPGMVLVVEKYK